MRRQNDQLAKSDLHLPGGLVSHLTMYVKTSLLDVSVLRDHSAKKALQKEHLDVKLTFHWSRM